MRTESKVATLSLALLAVAGCSKRQNQSAALSDDLRKDLAAASAASSDLAIAPTNYQRMRFVSDIEQSRATVRAQRPKVSRHPDRMTASNSPLGTESETTRDPMATMASEAPTTVSTPEAPAAEPVVVAARPAPEPSSGAGSSSEGGVGESSHGGGLGGLLGGLIGSVVIRGGRGGSDKCDPRTDGRARQGNDRPDFGLPIPTGQVFGGRHR